MILILLYSLFRVLSENVLRIAITLHIRMIMIPRNNLYKTIKGDIQVLSKLIDDFYEYVYELLSFLCGIKNAGYLKNEEVQNIFNKYIMPKINNEINKIKSK
ncbi:hypothetical protein H8356DRAFT_948905 [Neocallimastix lanati (nom. inval.)]|uniref:Uncharacterized protein n=1 Tax=Neocallimastix californiae TaxID=1754190 RepID=A0A1Y2EP50_9FUNG|nr:hypothetical protein H8356DRAFT_948905 [Neocallimastix sp. JGI-2020a]ORY73319.1 hypothetical protein LY90DRAFT_503173 [Neocallimastix californiae]|eukprot:ORY73319.1 hypothetical protein LY90DRAFT_503173 [Neocallimastix californiae]